MSARFYLQAEDGIRDGHVTGVQTCALPIGGLVSLWPDRSVSSHGPRPDGGPAAHQADLDRCRAERDNGPVPRRTTQAPGESVPVGAAEIAARLGVRPQTVHTWRHRKLMPEPRWTV